MEKKLFYSWKEAYQAGAPRVGGKGWNLGRLDYYGFRIPPGCVLCVNAYSEFVRANKLEHIYDISGRIDLDNINDPDIKNELDKIRGEFEAGILPAFIEEKLTQALAALNAANKPMAVRSSATAEDSAEASFAGIHESYLNIRGVDKVVQAIKRCYASLWTERAIAYRRKMGISDDEASMAIVIMEMVNTEAAGIGFTCDPITGREEIIAINANFGLGESVVSGKINPDQYYIDNSKALLKIAKKQIGQKDGMTVPKDAGETEFVSLEELRGSQVLSDDDIIRLGYLMLRAFWILGNGEQHQDMEWVFDGEDFLLVQARPVTAIPRYTFEQVRNQPDIWSNANFRDVVPIVQSTLSWSSCWMLRRLLEAPFRQLEYPLPEGIKLTRLYQGRLYLNMAVYQWGFYDAIGMEPREMTASLGGHEPEIIIDERKNLSKVLKRKRGMLKLVQQISKAKKIAGASFAEIKQKTRFWIQKDMASFEPKDFIRLFAELEEVACKFAPVYMMLALSGNYPNTTVTNILEGTFPGRGIALLNALMTGSANLTSADQGYRLAEMAKLARNDEEAGRFFANSYDPLLWEKLLPESSPFKAAFRNYIAEFGHRGIYELDLINPRWREEPSYLLGVIRGLIYEGDLDKIIEAQQKKREGAWEEINKRVPIHKRWMIRYWLKETQRAAELREMAKSVLVMLEEPLRDAAKEIGCRLEKKGLLSHRQDIFHCSWGEITSFLLGFWDGAGLKTIVAERKDLRNKLEALSAPDFIVEEQPHFSEKAKVQPGQPINGLGVSAGRAGGVACLLHYPGQGEDLRAGDVLVAPSTDPGWTPLFLKAAAIVMETGGFLSHGAIVAREYGIPAVVNIPGVMKIIEEGQKVIVDGDGGKVYLDSKE